MNRKTKFNGITVIVDGVDGQRIGKLTSISLAEDKPREPIYELSSKAIKLNPTTTTGKLTCTTFVGKPKRRLG